ncbi:MAG: MarR family transcriptional regulator [Nanoarchaeota archaeon]|nr:MarR family transcriptional regulator [Nanoarchaeota archaeon]
MKNLNNITKILIIILVVIISYFIIFLIIKPFFTPISMMDMMRQLTWGIRTDNIIPFIIALIAGIIVSFYLFEGRKDREYNIIRKALSEDEKKILDEIKKAGEITQDSLRFRLNWSKAKISTILTNLDKMGLIQRERTGKTYKIYLQKV